MKKIYFYPFGGGSSIFNDYMTVKHAIECGCEEIRTSSMANFSFSLLDQGYEIYLVSRLNREIRISPGMRELDKELRPCHHILKIFLAGGFDQLIYD